MFEPLQFLNFFRTLDVILDVVISKVLTFFVANSTHSTPETPLGTVDLEDTVGVAGLCLWTSYFSGIESTLVLHDTDEIADECPGDATSDEFLDGLALSQNLRLAPPGEES